MLLEFQLDWIKIVDFLLVAKFKACLLFFTHTLYVVYWKQREIYSLPHETSLNCVCAAFA